MKQSVKAQAEAEMKYQKFLQETRSLLGEKGSPRIEWTKQHQVCGGGIRLIRKPLPNY